MSFRLSIPMAAVVAITGLTARGEDREVIVPASNIDVIKVRVGQVIRVTGTERPGMPVTVSVDGFGKVIATSLVRKTDKGIAVIENEVRKEFDILATATGKLRISVNTANASKATDGSKLGLSTPYHVEVVEALPKKD